MRIGYLSGPVDGVAVYNARLTGAGIDYLGTMYLREFLDACDDVGAEPVVVTSLASEQKVWVGDRVTIANFPKPPTRSGLAYHLDQLVWIWSALDFFSAQSVDILVLTDAQNYWFALAFHSLRRIRLVLALHCAIKTPFSRPKAVHRVLLRWNRVIYRRRGCQAIVASPLIERKVRQVMGKVDGNTELFLPTYSASQFATCVTHYGVDGPLRILSAGRIEENKGVFDIVDMARIMEARGDVNFRFDICGTGGKLNDLRSAVQSAQLPHRITLHGYCGKDRLIDLLGESHVVIVPTRSSFEEGFAMICAEATLAGRPLVTSQICPAIELVMPATVEAKVDSVDSYVAALVALAHDTGLRQLKREGALAVRDQFLDPANGYRAKLRQAIERLAPAKAAPSG